MQYDSQSIEIENPSKEAIEIKLIEKPKYLDVKIIPNKLDAGERGKIDVYFDSKLIPTYGSCNSRVDIEILFGKAKQRATIGTSVRIVEDFSNLSKIEIKNSPKIIIPKRKIDLGDIINEDVIEIEYKNVGVRDLLIRRIEINNSSYTLVGFDAEIKSGKSGIFLIKPNISRREKKLSASIRIISNDPSKSEIVVQVFSINTKFSNDNSFSKSKIEDIEIEKANKIIETYAGSDKLIILDVRTPDEFSKGALINAVNIDVQEDDFVKLIELLPKNKLYLVYCKAGIRSKKATEIMFENNFNMIFHMYKGYEKWEK